MTYQGFMATCILSFVVSGALADDKPPVPQSDAAPKAARAGLPAWVRALVPCEFAEMLTAVLSGSSVGPGDGWFRPSQSRYGWEWLAARYNSNGDDRIAAAEYGGPADYFRRLDRNGDGALTAEDLDWSPRSAFVQQSTPARMWFQGMDADSNGRISREEWERVFAKAAKTKGYVTQEDLRQAFPTAPPPRSPAAKGGKPAKHILVAGLLTGELGSPFEGPRLGQPAPDFTLPTHDGKQQINLSAYRGDKPLVLIFGSFT